MSAASEPGGADYLARRTRELAEVLRERFGIGRGARVRHAELGEGTIERIASGGRHAVVEFDNRERYTVHLLDLAVTVEAPPGPSSGKKGAGHG